LYICRELNLTFTLEELNNIRVSFSDFVFVLLFILIVPALAFQVLLFIVPVLGTNEIFVVCLLYFVFLLGFILFIFWIYIILFVYVLAPLMLIRSRLVSSLGKKNLRKTLKSTESFSEAHKKMVYKKALKDLRKFNDKFL
jgi:hypothetical protein